MFRDESWKKIYVGSKGQKVTSHKNVAGVGLCTFVSAGCLQLNMFRSMECRLPNWSGYVTTDHPRCGDAHANTSTLQSLKQQGIDRSVNFR